MLSKKKLIILSISGIFISCATNSYRKFQYPVAQLEKNDSLIARADRYYTAENFSLAKLYYDTLINLDSNQGIYYYRRVFSKSEETRRGRNFIDQESIILALLHVIIAPNLNAENAPPTNTPE